LPLAPSLDPVGPLARSVADLAVLLPVWARAGARQRPAARRDGLRGVRVGVADDPYFRAIDPEVAVAVATAAAILRDLGADVRPLALPDPAPMMAATATIVRAEATAAHGALLDEAPEKLQPLVRDRLEEGRRLTATAYLHALDARGRLRHAFVREVFSAVHIVLAPVTPEAPVPLRETSGPPARVAERMARWARFARLFNGLGIPVLALPAALSPDGLPLGVQMAGPPFADAALLDVGQAFERAAGWPRRPPGVSRAPKTLTTAYR
jgi:aspartyl-tRNA(Asn)/glutamyl-tRNA(Gln) amidotransferase subunit A